MDQGAHNLNFVNPTHYAHVVGRLLEEHPQPVPVVWNSGGYDRVDTLRALEGKIQIYLPDLKYLDRRRRRAVFRAPPTILRQPRPLSGRWCARPALAPLTGMACLPAG